MQNYLDSKECLMQFLQKRLSDESIDACGNCSVCSTDNNWFSEGPDDELIQKATVFLKKLKGEIKPRKKWNHKFRSWPFLTDHWDSDTESKMIKKGWLKLSKTHFIGDMV